LRWSESEQFLKDLEQAWSKFTDNPLVEAGDAMLMELKPFSLAVEVSEATDKRESTGKASGWMKRLLRKASTVIGSVKDIVDNLPSYAKNAITLFKELVDLFKGRERKREWMFAGAA
jgi:hypothetical protein